MLDPQTHQDPDDPTNLQRPGASAKMTSKSTMSERLALATKITQRTGMFTDPRGWDEKSLADMAPEFAAMTLDPYDLMRWPPSRDFVIDYPHGEVVISKNDLNSDEPVTFCRTQCLRCFSQEEHSHEESRGKFPTACARIAWKGKDVAILPQSGQPGEENVVTFVNGQFVSERTFKLLCPGDMITFRKDVTAQPFYRLHVGKIAYGGLQPTHRSKDFKDKELAMLHRLGTHWSFDMVTAVITAVGMVILGGLAMFFFQAIPSNAVN